jgi:hypothetical protein
VVFGAIGLSGKPELALLEGQSAGQVPRAGGLCRPGPTWSRCCRSGRSLSLQRLLPRRWVAWPHHRLGVHAVAGGSEFGERARLVVAGLVTNGVEHAWRWHRPDRHAARVARRCRWCHRRASASPSAEERSSGPDLVIRSGPDAQNAYRAATLHQTRIPGQSGVQMVITEAS